MKKFLRFTWVALALGCSAHHGPLSIFKKSSPHDAYGQHLSDAGLAGSALARNWQQQAGAALASPVTIELPYQETGYFPAERAMAEGYAFVLKRGQKIKVTLELKPVTLAVYADLFTSGALVASADSTGLIYEVQQAGTYILRLQPELLAAGQYTLRVTTGPALHFPVSSSGHPKIEGYWGDGRDDNSRKHEGIDIFAPKGTPALAAANGTVVNVGENKLGGLVVLLQPKGADYTLYYAHLGVQLVRAGQQVMAGDTVGLIDNTGNAKTTPSHLHFGIYAGGRAIDPLLFVKPARETLPVVTADLSNLNTAIAVDDMPCRVLAAFKDDYKVLTPENKIQWVLAKRTRSLRATVLIARHMVPLYDRPDTAAPRMLMVSSGEKMTVRGSYGSFELVSYKQQTGWALK